MIRSHSVSVTSGTDPSLELELRQETPPLTVLVTTGIDLSLTLVGGLGNTPADAVSVTTGIDLSLTQQSENAREALIEVSVTTGTDLSLTHGRHRLAVRSVESFSYHRN